MAKKNFTITTVATAPSPATTGTSLIVASGDGALFAVNEPAIIFPVNDQPLVANAEIVMVTNVSTDTLTITRTQESTSARTIVAGDIIIQGITAKDWNDLVTLVSGKITAFADPNADRIVFWDDSAGAFAALTASTGLTLSGTDLTVRAASETATGIVERATDTEFTDGTDTTRFINAKQAASVAQTMTNKTLTSPVIDTGVSGTAVLDEDNMASDSATKLATQQSIKAYVDGLAATEVIQDKAGAMFTGNTETFIAATYQDDDGTIDLVVPVKDEDNMASDSATDLPTQQSVKAYTDLINSNNSAFIQNEIKVIDTATYDSFGLLIKIDNDNAIYFFRQGTSHVGDKGKIVAQKYTFSTQTWGTRWDVYNDANANYDSRNVAGGVIGDKIYLFFTRYNISGAALQDIGYIVSTDLTGTSWGSYTAITTGFSWGSPYGALIDTNTVGKYIVPIYGDNGSGTYYVKFFETEDSGANWAVGDTIYSGASSFTETCVAHLGSGNMIALMRINAGGLVYQSKSTNDGVTWSTPSVTNMGEPSGTKVPWVYYCERSNTLVAIFKDRTGLYPIKIYTVDADLALTSNLLWEYLRWSDDSANLASSGNGGYPSIVSISDDKLMYVFYDGTDSDVDTYMGILNLGMLSKVERQDGWRELVEIWTYVSSTTFTANGNKESRFEVGDKIKWYQSAWKYGYIVNKVYSSGTGLTTITVAGNSISNAVIYIPHVSKVESPQDFPQWFSYTPTISAGSGTFTTVSATGKFKVSGKICFVSVTITITTNGTAASFTLASLPITASVTPLYALFGRETLATGKMLQGQVTGSRVNDVFIRDYTNAYCGGNGYTLNVSGWYEIA